jgi:hypothetical protein
VGGDVAQHGGGIRLELEDVASDDRVEALLEHQLGRVAFAKRHVAQRLLIGTASSNGERVGRSIGTDHLARLTHEVGDQECDVAGAAADVEHAHPGDDPGFDQEPSRDRIDEPRLNAETLQLPLGMTERVGGRLGFGRHPPDPVKTDASRGQASVRVRGWRIGWIAR